MQCLDEANMTLGGYASQRDCLYTLVPLGPFQIGTAKISKQIYLFFIIILTREHALAKVRKHSL